MGKYGVRLLSVNDNNVALQHVFASVLGGFCDLSQNT